MTEGFSGDVLELIREAVSAKRRVGLEEGTVVIEGGVKIPGTTATRYLSSGGSGAPYTAAAIAFLLEHHELATGEYVRRATRDGMPKVSIVDKSDLLDYLFGRTSGSAAIAPLSSSTTSSAPGESGSGVNGATTSVTVDGMAGVTSNSVQRAGTGLEGSGSIGGNGGAGGVSSANATGSVAVGSSNGVGSGSSALGGVGGGESGLAGSSIGAKRDLSSITLAPELLGAKKKLAERLIKKARTNTAPPRAVAPAPTPAPAESGAGAAGDDGVEAGEVISAAKIAELKAKRAARKRTEIGGGGGGGSIGSMEEDTFGGDPEMERFVKVDRGMTAMIRERERTVLSRKSVLRSGPARGGPQRSFESVLEVLRKERRRKEREDREKAKKIAQDVRESASGTRYLDRTDAQQWAELDSQNALAELGINPSGSFLPSRPQGSGPQPSSSRGRSGDGRARTSSSRSSSSATNGEDRKPAPPVIIVPASNRAVLNLFNAKSFFQDGKYITPEEGRAAAGGKKPQKVTVTRKTPRGNVVTFELMDNPIPLLAKRDGWKRVVGVVAAGPDWQFKGWPVSQPVEIFSRWFGVHFGWDDESMPANIKKWRVKPITLSKTKRHLDIPSSRAFWLDMEAHLRQTRLDLEF